MGSKNKAPQARMPTASELAPLVDLQAQYNRVGVSTPFGSQRYEVGPDGRSSTMVTDIGPEGRALVGRAMGFANTDSNRMQVPDQLNGLAQALMNRVGGRLGMGAGQGLELSQRPNMPSAKQQSSQPMPNPEVGGNRPPMSSAPMPSDPSRGGGYLGAIRAGLDRNRSRQ